MLISCEKEKDSSILLDYLVIDTSSVDYTYKKVIGKDVYASLWGSSLPDYTIDLNNDGTDDIQFSCSVYHHTVYDEWYAGIDALNDSVAIAIESHPVLYASYSQTYFNPSSNDSITIYYKENYNEAKQYPSNLTIKTQTETNPLIHSLGDTLNENCSWKSGGIFLEYDDHHGGQIQNNIQTGTWRSIDHKYIGIRFSEKSIPYYGWIELGVSNYHITLYKYAVRK
jgi:hypothetical protein